MCTDLRVCSFLHFMNAKIVQFNFTSEWFIFINFQRKVNSIALLQIMQNMSNNTIYKPGFPAVLRMYLQITDVIRYGADSNFELNKQFSWRKLLEKYPFTLSLTTLDTVLNIHNIDVCETNAFLQRSLKFATNISYDVEP